MLAKAFQHLIFCYIRFDVILLVQFTPPPPPPPTPQRGGKKNATIKQIERERERERKGKYLHTYWEVKCKMENLGRLQICYLLMKIVMM